MPNPNSDYWKDRFEQIEQSSNVQGIQCYAEIEKQYRRAQKSLEGQIAAWYQRFAENNSITILEAQKMLTNKELQELKWDINEYIKYGEENALDGVWCKQLENASAKYHISRLEALKIQTQQILEAMFGNQLDSIDSSMKAIYTDGYYHTAFEIQKGFGIGFDLASLDEKQISKVINTPWAVDGRNFSQRIWGNRQKLVNELQNDLTRNIILGQNPQKAIDAISRKMKTSKTNAGRLIMTEEAFFNSAAQNDCFTELSVEQYEIVATLDSRTSEICQDMDGKVFAMKDYEVGVTAPPFHVFCRSTTVPYFSDDFGVIGERAARTNDGKTYYVPSNMKYDEWKESFVADSISESTKKTYYKFKDILGDNSPTVDDFAKIRYNDNDWKAFKAYTSSIKSGELTPLADFKLYQDVSNQINGQLLGIETSTGVNITGKSNHSIARMIGSVEQKRNGVVVSDVMDALTSKESEILPIKTLTNGKSQKFRNEAVEVSINPDTGNIIQVNPVHTRKKVKS
jgi:SPP1 gp7 family putative phage head morphogenesis protein